MGEHEHHGPDYFSCGGRESQLSIDPETGLRSRRARVWDESRSGWWLEAEVGKLWGSLELGTHAQPRALRLARGTLSALPVARQRRRPLFSCSLQSCLLSPRRPWPWKGGGVAWTTLRYSCVSVAEFGQPQFQGSDRPSSSVG